MSLHLSQEAAAIHELPSEYKMVVADRNVDNTFIFSEKDLPGYRKFSHGRAPPRFKDRKRVEKGGRPEKHFRTFIPSECSKAITRKRHADVSALEQTNLVGQVQTEINCLPVENGDFQQYIAREKKRREVQKPKIARWDEAANNGNVIIPGDINTALRYSGFIVGALAFCLQRVEVSDEIDSQSLRLRGRTRRRPLECHKMSSWIVSSNASGHSSIGASRA